MNLETMNMDELEARRAQISGEIDAPEADLDALETEARAINEEIEKRKAEETQKAEIRKAVAEGAGEVTKEIKEERKEMTLEEIRSSKEYVNAFADYIKTGDDKECRALLTSNVSGSVPVPVIVEGRIREAWEKTGILSLVRKTYVRGNLKVGFELSAGSAYVHTEGTSADTEESLTFGVVTMVPASIKKWITISDEALDMGGEEFLDYIYDELTYQIARKCEAVLVTTIAGLSTSASSTAVSANQVTASSISIGLIAAAIANLADNATNPVVVMNKLTYADFKAAQYAASYAADPFEGLPVIFNNTLPAFSAASANDIFAIVGDFGVGAQANFPNGAEINIKFDDLSLAEKDLVKLVGRMYVGLGVVSDKAFCNLKKVSA